MKNSIFVPLDLSDVSTSYNVTLYAANLARRLNNKVILFHTYALPQMITDPSASAGMIQAVPMDIEYQKKTKNKKLEELVNEVPDLTHVETELIAVPGSAVDLINEYALQKLSYLIVMGSSNHSGIAELFFSPKDEKITRSAPCSVLVLPKDYKYKPLRNISLAIDNDQLEHNLQLDILFSIVENYEASLHIVHIEEGDNQGKKQSEIHDSVVKRLGDYTYSYNTASNPDVHKGISKFNQELSIDISALIYREHGFFERFLNPGVRKELIKNTESPLLILK